jgi:hypothetical protein
MQRKCSQCKEFKEINCFHNKKTGLNGKESMCKECRSKKYSVRNKEYSKTYIRKKPRITYISTKTHLNGKIICTTCAIEKELTEYYYDISIQNYKEICKDCKSNHNKEYRIDNRDEINNKRSIERQINPQIRIRDSFSSRLCHLVKNQSKSSKLLSKYLGCSFDEFIKWIQYQFVEGMTMDNYGKEWHIDHVKPCASYDLTNEKELGECMNWKNLRPCWKMENLSKGSKINDELILEHCIKAHNYNYKILIKSD